MIDLEKYGWNDTLNRLKQASIHQALFHGRVAIVHRSGYEVIAENGLFQCELSGNMAFGKPDVEWPCVGDWVIFQAFDENRGMVVEVLPRERTLYRRKSGTVAGKQAIVSYVDRAFIVQGLDDNFNVRRAERFVAQILEENIKPVLVLNKADSGFDRQAIDGQIGHIARGIPVFFTSIYQPETILRLRESISEGETVVFVGSSGVGKSSLVNALCEKAVLLTSGISQATGKGRHTSTRREMVLMDGSGVLIDTPGVREFGLAIDNTGSFADMLAISGYAKACRFRDCGHRDEPGCAVREAVNKGQLPAGVYESFLKLQREARHFSSSEHEKRQKDKSFSRLVGEAKKQKGYR